VADAVIISTFWDGMMYHSLVHELSHEQPKITKELLDIATRHASVKEAVGTAFFLGNATAVANNGRAAPTKATITSTRFATSSTTAVGSGPVEEEGREWRETAPAPARSATEASTASPTPLQRPPVVHGGGDGGLPCAPQAAQ
jgi:hypothetical protein